MWILNDICNNDSRRYYSCFSEKPIIEENAYGPRIANFHNNFSGCIEECFLPKLDYLESVEINICIKGDVNILSNYTDEQLKVELDKRKLARRGEKEEILRCRHCANFDYGSRPIRCQQAYCTKQILTNKKGITRFRIVSKSNKACSNFIHKDNEKVK